RLVENLFSFIWSRKKLSSPPSAWKSGAFKFSLVWRPYFVKGFNAGHPWRKLGFEIIRHLQEPDKMPAVNVDLPEGHRVAGKGGAEPGGENEGPPTFFRTRATSKGGHGRAGRIEISLGPHRRFHAGAHGSGRDRFHERPQ